MCRDFRDINLRSEIKTHLPRTRTWAMRYDAAQQYYDSDKCFAESVVWQRTAAKDNHKIKQENPKTV